MFDAMRQSLAANSRTIPATKRPTYLQPLAFARRVLRELALVVGLGFGLLAVPFAAHAEDCWQILQDGGGTLQGWLGGLPRQCFGSASGAVNFVLAQATEVFAGPPTSLPGGHLYWSDNVRAVNSSNGLGCPQVGNEVGAQESCWIRFTSHHRFPNGTEEHGEAGNGWFAYYLVKCPDGTTLDLATNRCLSTLRISLAGPSSTKSLPAGPVLPQAAIVTSNGAAAAGKAVSIAMSSGSTASGTTDASGQFRFIYIPPRGKTLDQLTATCSGCSNAAQKTISVESCDVCEGKKGNPVNIGASEKEQDESDWQDASAHPLTLTRHYRSFGTSGAAGLGGYWSHDYAPLLTRGELGATLKMGDASKVLFHRDTAASLWVADNRKDVLTDTPAGATYIRADDESRFAFDVAGKLQSITGRNGWVMTLVYNATGQLTSITNAFGRALQFSYDPQGRLTRVATPDAKTISYGYDIIHRLTAVTYPDGASRGYYYEDARWPNALTGITDEGGTRYATFGYDDAGRAVSTQHAGGAQNYTVNYSADAGSSGTLSTNMVVDPALYRSIVRVTDPQGNVQTYAYQGGDGNVRLLGVDGAYEGGQVANRGFAGTSTLAQSETDFLGVTTAYTWDTDRQLKLSTTKAAGLPEAQTSSTQWHPAFRLPVLLTEAGRSTAYTYDSWGNKLSETITDLVTGQARAWTWTYNTQGLNDTMTDPKGGLWRYTYSALGNRTSMKNPLGQQTSYAYDALGGLSGQTEPSGLVSSYSYDARGRLLQANRGGELTSYTYTPFGQVASAALPNGYRLNYSYDAAQRLIAARDNNGNLIQYTLDGMGNRVREEVKDAAGNIAKATGRVIGYLNNVKSIQGAMGQSTYIDVDANGETVGQTDPLNQITRHTLDPLRRPVATSFADGAVAGQSWSQLNQLTAVTDPKGVATGYQTNAFGEVMSETSPDIGQVTYQRDALGDVISRTDAKGNTTSITRDALGRPTSIQYSADHMAHFTYDANPMIGANQTGFLSRIEDKSGTTAYERDAWGRIITKTQAVNDNPGSPSSYKTSYSYINGDLAGITYPSGLKIFYRRSASGQIAGIDTQEPGRNKPVNPFVSNLTWTAVNQPKAWTWSSGDSASRSFDADARMTASEFAIYSYDGASRITGITQSLWASSTATGTVSLYTTPLSWTAGYDSRNRLISFTRAGAATNYTYDANSNRLSSVDSITSDIDLDGNFEESDMTLATGQSLGIDASSNKLLGFVQTVTRIRNGHERNVSTTPIVYSLDENGAMTSDGLRSFQYDASNRLAKVRLMKDGEAASVSYLHNALGQRVFKSEVQAAQTLPDEQELGTGFIDWLKKNFKWMFAQAQANASVGTAYNYADGALPQWAMLGEYDNGSAGGTGRTEYIWLPGEDGNVIPVGYYRSGKFFAVHTDHLGTPRLVTNEANTPVWQWPYSGFGNNKPTGVLEATPNPKAAITNQPVLLKATAPRQKVDFGFPGQWRDEETGAVYNYFRNYDPRTGRYTQSDPIGLDGGWSRFEYVDGNPLNDYDPEGLKGKKSPPIPGDLGKYPYVPDFWRTDNYRKYRDGYFASICVRSSCEIGTPNNMCTFADPQGRGSMRTGSVSMSVPGQNSNCICTEWAQDWREGIRPPKGGLDKLNLIMQTLGVGVYH